MSKLISSLKATTASPSFDEDEDPIAILQRAQAAYEAEILRSRKRQREILQEIYRGTHGLLEHDDVCGRFMFEEEFTKFANKPPNEADRGDVWFHAVAFAYRAESREDRQKASKDASALRFLYEERVPADRVAETLKQPGGIQGLASEAAKRRLSQKSDSGDAAWEEADKAPADATKETTEFSMTQVASPSTLNPKQSDGPEDLPAPTQSPRETVKDTTSPPPVGQKTMPLNAPVPSDSRIQSPPVPYLKITIMGENGTSHSIPLTLSAEEAAAATTVLKRTDFGNRFHVLGALKQVLERPERAMRKSQQRTKSAPADR